MRLGKDFLGGFGDIVPQIVVHLYCGIRRRCSSCNCCNTRKVEPYRMATVDTCQLYEVHGVLICLVLCTQCTISSTDSGVN